MQAQTLSMGPVEWLLLLVLAMLWGATYFFVEIALEDLRPLTIVLIRVALAGAALTIVLYARGLSLPTGLRPWGPFFVMAALNNVVPFSLIMWGQTEITSGLAAILNATTPFFAVVLAHFLTRDEKLTAAKLAGVVIGAGGVAVLMGPEALEGMSAGLLAQLALLTASVFYAVSGIYAKRFKATPPLVIATSQMLAATILMAPLALIVDRPWAAPMPGLATLAALVSLAVLGTALAYIIYFRILATAGATNLLLVTLLIPVTAMLLGALALGEHLEARHYVGMAVIGVALVIVDGRLVRWAARAFRSPGLQA